jgi:tetratricopeptide (TPR) repeat protein
MIRATAAAFLPVRIALWWARRSRDSGDAHAALAMAGERLRRLNGKDPRCEPFQYLRGLAFCDLQRGASAAEAFLAGYSCTRADATAFSFLAGQLLRGTLHTRAVGALLDYFRHVPPGDDPADVAARQEQFRKRLAPRQNALADLFAWNAAVHHQFPQWSWPRLHLGWIAASREQWSDAARELEPIATTDPTARALVAYVLVKAQRPHDARRFLDFSLTAQTPRTVLLLQAHAHRLTGNVKAAVALFERAEPDTRDDVLCYAESLINANRPAAAWKALQPVEAQDDPRWLLLAGSSAPSDDHALQLLSRCFGDETYAASAVARALLILHRNPSVATPGRDKTILQACTGEHAPFATTLAGAFARHAQQQIAEGARAAAKALQLGDSVRSRVPSLSSHPDVLFARASLLIATFDPAVPWMADECADAVNRLDSNEPRVRRIAAAVAALSGDYDRALHLLGSEENSLHRAALQYLGGETSSSPYYAALHAARSGFFDRANEWLDFVPDEAPLNSAAQRVRAWVALQEARQHAARGARDIAANRIAAAIEHCASLVPAMPRLLPWLIDSGARASAHAAFASATADPALCHQRGIYHLCEAERHASRSEWDEATAQGEAAIACFTVALADDDYLQQWIDDRVAVYDTTEAVDADALKNAVLTRLTQWLDRSQKALDEDEGAGRLSLALRAEVRAASLAGPALDGGHVPAAMGPLGVRCFSLEGPFARFVAGLRSRRKDDADTFERVFSDLRYAAILEENDQLEAALHQLRSARGFAPCNPAFESTPKGERLFRRAAQKLEASLLLRLGEQEISTDANGIAAGLAHWRETLDLSRNGTRGSTVATIRNLALGRARTLDERDRYDEAIALLTGVNELCGDESIQGELATIHAHAAIDRANACHDWDLAIEGLRKARELNRRSPFIDQNLAVALLNRAHEIDETQKSVEYFQEALEIAEANLRFDRDNSQWQQLVEDSRGGLMFAAFQGGDISRRPPKTPLLTTGLSSGRGTQHRERASEHLVRGQYAEAAEELRTALRLDPNDHHAREELAGTLMRMLNG